MLGPGRRLRQIATATTRRKARNPSSLGTVFRCRMPPAGRLEDHGAATGQPRQRLRARATETALPSRDAAARGFPRVLTLIAKTTLGVGALSYAGQFSIMAAADHDACPTSTCSSQPPKTNCGHSPRPPRPGPAILSCAEPGDPQLEPSGPLKRRPHVRLPGRDTPRDRTRTVSQRPRRPEQPARVQCHG